FSLFFKIQKFFFCHCDLFFHKAKVYIALIKDVLARMLTSISHKNNKDFSCFLLLEYIKSKR
ncbi:MAG: hypothetical protein M0P33_07480, partial [Massilibacteroides sp.]|nr:hypothetical protein [Massilibacteroides sp.]